MTRAPDRLEGSLVAQDAAAGSSPRGGSEASPDEYDHDDEPGCYNCDMSGWRHGCLDDMCRGANEGDECPDAIPCRECNPRGEVMP